MFLGDQLGAVRFSVVFVKKMRMPLGVLEMLHGKSAQAIAVANTAILMELIQELVRRGEFTKPNAIALKMDRMQAASELARRWISFA